MKYDDGTMKCNLCEFVLKVDEKSPLLLEHLKNSHKDVYDLHKDNPEATVGFHIEFLQLNVMKDDAESKMAPVILEEVCEATTVPVEKSPVKIEVEKESDTVSMQYVLMKGDRRKVKKDSLESRRRSWVWKYFDKLSNIIFRCNICNVVLSIKGCNTNNMNRHVRTRHPDVYKLETKKGEKADNLDLSEVETPYAIKTEEIYATDKELEDSIIETSQKLRRSSWIWSYFNRVSATAAECKLCQRHICHGGNATGNMNRHLKMIHHKSAFDNNWVWKVFDGSEEDYYSCKICQYKCIKHPEIDKSISNILHHLKSEHGVVSGEQIITGTDIEEN